MANNSTLRSLAERLYQRRNQAVNVERVGIEGGDWQPTPNDCHANVTTWCRLQPRHAPVRGWLVADYPEIRLFKFFAHSVVRLDTGELADITPNPAPWVYPFLEHDPADGDFAEIVGSGQVTALDHPLR